ncbi:ankyrin repeat containing protein C20orf12 [Echinococcus multilocularis]|uniref:Ankyrin repeat containing protein C20orf12 n=1 Tax=Echinococcus multilocularis TaxID=6211 RepID=A0A087VYM2_ECHMU|nr:ankyrin repeat containing protein C20orf12 [Echinococcus multilocularis]
MPVGHVRAPLIVPLRLPVEGQYKNSIDCSTQVEISTDTPLARVYFTIDGSRPDPTSWKPCHPQSGPTYLFRGPFTLPAGAKTIKALAFIPYLLEMYLVRIVHCRTENPLPMSRNQIWFQSQKMERNMNNATHVRKKISFQKKVRWSPLGFFLLDKVEVEKDSKEVGDVVWKPSISKSPEGRPTKAVGTTSWEQDRFSVISVEGDKPKKVSPNVNLCRINRLQRAVDIFNCPTCLTSRPVDADAAFCATCGTSLPRLPSPIIAPARKIANSDVCITCGSRMVVNANKCLVCESPKGHLKKALIGEPDSMDRRLCSACGSLNPTRVKFCLTCEAVLPLTAANLINISSLLRNPQKSPSSPPPSTSANTTFSSRLVAGCRICSRQNSLGARFCDWCGIQEPCDVDLASQLQSYAVCPKCFWQTPRDSRFCSQCGFGFAGASETSSLSDVSLGPSTRAFESGNHSLVSLTPRSNRTVSTQTVGLFYPGGGHSKPLVSPDNPIKSPPRSRPHMMGFVSPGKGLSTTLLTLSLIMTTSLWRMQLEHLVAHVKAYTRNNVDFQKAVGEPRMEKLVYAEVDESQPEEVSLCFTFKRHSPLPRACTLGETTETSTGVVEDGDRMSSSFATAIPRSRRQTNNNALDISHPLLAASTPISHCDASCASGKTTKSIPSPSVHQPFRSSSPKSNLTDEVLHRGLDKLQESSGSFTKDSSLGHEEDANTVDQLWKREPPRAPSSGNSLRRHLQGDSRSKVNSLNTAPLPL